MLSGEIVDLDAVALIWMKRLRAYGSDGVTGIDPAVVVEVTILDGEVGPMPFGFLFGWRSLLDP